jgi:Spy/CpxP family protein refolding chaperone
VKRLTAASAVLAVFLLGALVGALGTHLFYAHHFHHPGMLSALGARWIAADLHRRLDLTPEQQTRIDAILADARRESLELRRQMAPQISHLMETAHARISQVLTPEQRKRFESYHAEHREHIRRMWSGGH